MPADGADLDVLRSKRDATRYRLLVALAERQPAVSQRELADAVGVTTQAVSDYLGELSDAGYVVKHGRGRYEVTKEGVDWLITQTESLREFLGYVSEEVIDEVDVETAIALGDVAAGDAVSLSMRDGVLHAAPGTAGSATAIAVTDAEAGGDVGVTEFEGLLDHEPGTVTVVAVPRVRDGGGRTVEPDALRERVAAHDLVAVAGTEALAAARGAGVEPDIRFGSVDATAEAAMKGLDVLLVAVTTSVSPHTGALREHSVGYEVVEPRID